MTAREPSPGALRWAAGRLIDMHGEAYLAAVPGRSRSGCARCQAEGPCPALAWALEIVGARPGHGPTPGGAA